MRSKVEEAGGWKLAAVAAVLFCLPGAALAQERITSFQVQAALSTNRNLKVEETISYDFDDAQKHGIYREIPVSYARDGANYNLRLSVTGVTMDGEAETYTQSRSGDGLEIKIGDANTLISGKHVYKIDYATDRAINFFPDGHSELYWNVTGAGWEVPIEESSFALQTPSNLDLDMASSTCFTGVYGSTESSCELATSSAALHVASMRVLLPNEGMTVAYAFPAGVITPPTTQEKIWMFIQDNGAVFFPLFALLLMHALWMWRGRDPSVTVIPEYDAPRKLAPALVGAALTNGNVPKETVTATIIDLARRGYLVINFGEEEKLWGATKTFTFIKKKDADEGLSDFEKAIFNGLFSSKDQVTLKELQKEKFYEDVQKFSDAVQATIDGLKYFVTNPNLVRVPFIAMGLCVGLGLANYLATPFAAVMGILAGIIIAIYGFFMPRRTADGAKCYAEIKGFKWFLSVTEKERLDFTDAPERTPEQFQKFLPYAIALGVEEKWAKQFASLTLPPPSWAQGNMTSYNTLWLVSNLHTMHEAAATAAYAPPSSAGSGGSGFSGGGSGGGFGGGGGGSW